MVTGLVGQVEKRRSSWVPVFSTWRPFSILDSERTAYASGQPGTVALWTKNSQAESGWGSGVVPVAVAPVAVAPVAVVPVAVVPVAVVPVAVVPVAVVPVAVVPDGTKTYRLGPGLVPTGRQNRQRTCGRGQQRARLKGA